jgi:hypothetical protein
VVNLAGGVFSESLNFPEPRSCVAPNVLRAGSRLRAYSAPTTFESIDSLDSCSSIPDE